MKKILISLSAIAIVAAVAVGATVAYFSDTESSIGNTFTAGSLDLIVNVDGQAMTSPVFDLPDMKPGDLGERTFEIKVDDNPACGFVNIAMISDDENTCTEPELVDETTCEVPGDGGELNDEVQFAIWADDCDNIFEVGESVLTGGTLTSGESWAIGELPAYDPKNPTDGLCYGVTYCFGTITTAEPVDGVIAIGCDGSQVGNEAQSDSFSGDITINAEQERNQYPNGCPEGEVQL